MKRKIECELCGSITAGKKSKRILHHEDCPTVNSAKDEVLVKDFIRVFRGDLLGVLESPSKKVH